MRVIIKTNYDFQIKGIIQEERIEGEYLKIRKLMLL